jgi:hypothetical protein
MKKLLSFLLLCLSIQAIAQRAEIGLATATAFYQSENISGTELSIFNQTGKRMSQGCRLARYDGTLPGMLEIRHYPIEIRYYQVSIGNRISLFRPKRRFQLQIEHGFSAIVDPIMQEQKPEAPIFPGKCGTISPGPVETPKPKYSTPFIPGGYCNFDAKLRIWRSLQLHAGVGYAYFLTRKAQEGNFPIPDARLGFNFQI